DHVVRVWTADGEPAALIRGHTSRVTGLVVSGDGSRIVTASRDDTIRVTNAHTGAVERVLAQPAHAIALTPDGKRVIAGDDGVAPGAPAMIRIFDIATGAA